jgi:DNA-binding NtrC family response regulator
MDDKENRKRLLIVDDERTILLSLGHLLRGSEVEVITCNRLDFALTAVKNYFFDVVLTDIRLSGLMGGEGLDLLEHIKKNSPNTRVIVITAYGSPETRSEVMAKGADCYFEKPINIKELLARLEEYGLPLSRKKVN